MGSMGSLGFSAIVYLGADYVWGSGVMTGGSRHTVRCTKWANYSSRGIMGIVLLILNVIKTKQSKTKLARSCNYKRPRRERIQKQTKLLLPLGVQVGGGGFSQLAFPCSHTSLGQDTG